MSVPCYALYKGDSFLDMGSKSYLARLIGVKIKTIEYYMSPAHRRKTKGNAYLVIKVEDD